ncbi:MAG: hypothetical protein Q9163_001129 [Psora crenata]
MEGAIDDFAVSSPKRQRVEEPDSMEVIDDIDDIYDASPAELDSRKQWPHPQTSFQPSDPVGVIHKAPQLPGLEITEHTVESSNGGPTPDMSNSSPLYVHAAGASTVPESDVIQIGAIMNKPPEVNIEVRQRDAQPSPPPERLPTESGAPQLPDTYKGAEPRGQPASNTCQERTRNEPETSQRDASTTEEVADVAIGQVKPSDSAKMFGQTSEELAGANQIDAEAEFEMDSSPLVSSSSDSSDESSSSYGSAAEDYEMLNPEEQARRLMAEDGGSDEEVGGKGSKSAGVLRTTNEKLDEVVPKPDIEVTADMKIEELGRVENAIENLVLIKATTSGEYQVLEYGSVLCLEDRTVIGVVADTLGRVQQPYYSVRFTNAAAISEAGIFKDTRVFYIEQHSTYIFTQPLKAFKGSDASNIHDEEVGDDELEFSDDEAEAEYRRRVKQQRQAKRVGRDGDVEMFSRGTRERGRGGSRRRGAPHGSSNGLQRTLEHPPGTEAALDYDDGNNARIDGHADELYTPLARPRNLHEIMGKQEAPTESQANTFNRSRGNPVRGRGMANRGFGRGRDRGCDQFNSGRGVSERGSLANAHAHGQANGYTASTQSNNFPAQPPPIHYSPPFSQSRPQHPSHSAWGPQDPIGPQQQQYAQQHQSYPSYTQQPSQYTQWPSTGQQQQVYQNSSHAQGYLMPQHASTYSMTPPNIPPGAHVNPAFFRQQTQNPASESWRQQQPPPLNQSDWYSKGQGYNG